MKNESEEPVPREKRFTVYILRCRDGSYYVGCTEKLVRRLRDHQNATAAAWTAKRLPIELVFQETHEDLLTARRREKQIKGWSRQKKEKLISGDWSKMKRTLDA